MMEASQPSRDVVQNKGTYTYTPLPTPTSIRLIHIGERDGSGLCCCSLKTVDLVDSPWYYAFSYTWGNPHAIAREGHEFTEH